jgi:hypothetical protein
MLAGVASATLVGLQFVSRKPRMGLTQMRRAKL